MMPGGREDDFITFSKGAGFNTTGDNAPVIKFIDILHREAQWLILIRGRAVNSSSASMTVAP